MNILQQIQPIKFPDMQKDFGHSQRQAPLLGGTLAKINSQKLLQKGAQKHI